MPLPPAAGRGAAIRQHFEEFWGQERDPALLLNAHYLTSEQIRVQGDEADPALHLGQRLPRDLGADETLTTPAK